MFTWRLVSLVVVALVLLMLPAADAKPLPVGSAPGGRVAAFDPATFGALKVRRSTVTPAAKPNSSTWCIGPRPGIKLKDVGTSMALFIGYAQLAANYMSPRLLRSASSSQRKRFARLAADFAARAKPTSIFVKACKKGATLAVPLRFDFVGAIGVTQGSASSRRGMLSTRQASGGLMAILANGALRDAVASGSAVITKVAVAPNGVVVVVFRDGVDLSDASPNRISSSIGDGCRLVTIVRATGIPTCIDPTLRSFSSPSSGEAIQFDGGGGIYYMGQVSGSMYPLLRRFKAGVVTDITNAQIVVGNYLVTTNGTVVLNGSTAATGATFSRRYSPSGGILSLGPPASISGHFQLFADGNVYMSGANIMAGANNGIARFLTTSDAMDPTLWIGSPATNDWSAYCAGAGVGTGPCVGFGAAGVIFGAQNAHAETSTGKDFIPGTNGIIQAFPTLAAYTTPIQTTSVMAASGTTLLLAGTTASGENLLVSFDTTTNTPTTIASRASANGEIEFYHVEPASDGTALFDGLRFSDNTYVIGRINCATGDVTILSTVTGKLDDFKTF